MQRAFLGGWAPELQTKLLVWRQPDNPRDCVSTRQCNALARKAVLSAYQKKLHEPNKVEHTLEIWSLRCPRYDASAKRQCGFWTDFIMRGKIDV